MNKFQETIEYINDSRYFKIGDLIGDIEGTYSNDALIEGGSSTIRIYVKLLLSAHFLKREGKGWYDMNDEVEFIPTNLTIKELKELSKFDNINMVFRYLSVQKLKKLSK